MTLTELREIQNSDFKLWEAAKTTEAGGVLTKEVDLPYGIGLFVLNFQGVEDATTRRNAAAMWGQAIRDEIENTIGNDAVTASAAQRTALLGGDDGEDGGPSKPYQDDAEAAEVDEEEAVSTFSTPATFSANPSRRLDELRRARDGHAKAARAIDLEVQALTAYMEVMNANTTTDETA